MVLISRLSMALQGIRDVALIVVSVLIISAFYDKWSVPTANFVFIIAVVFLIFSIINITLLLRKVTWKGFYYFNALAQLLPALLLTMLNLWIGPLFLTLNVAILASLVGRRKKRRESEQSKQA
jgi:hypothetical protein